MHGEQRLIETVLADLRLFRGASAVARAGVAAQCRTLALARGGALARRGERLPGLLALAYGSVKLRIPVNGSRERVIRIVAAGESFGESAALLDRPAPFEPVALANSKVVVIPPAAVFALIECDPLVARGAVLVLAERHLRLVEELHTRAPRRGVQRLASYLEALAEPVAGNGELKARLPGTKTLAAAQLGMSKETLSRLLRSLAARGVLRVSRREIAIVDRAALAALAAQAD
jgi:CRP/FNR family transcriptional regulator, dissimilatory nitrate respiration regulator